jgi:hypothetical protein
MPCHFNGFFIDLTVAASGHRCRYHSSCFRQGLVTITPLFGLYFLCVTSVLFIVVLFRKQDADTSPNRYVRVERSDLQNKRNSKNSKTSRVRRICEREERGRLSTCLLPIRRFAPDCNDSQPFAHSWMTMEQFFNVLYSASANKLLRRAPCSSECRHWRSSDSV